MLMMMMMMMTRTSQDGGHANLCNQDPLWAGAGHWVGMVGVVQIHLPSETSETFHTMRSSSCTYTNRIPMPSLANENQTQALSPKMQRDRR